jgi:hypothetical protein
MKNKDICYPYPVLGIGDDVASKPTLSATIGEDNDNFLIHIELDMQNVDIVEFIASGVAKYVCEVDCPATFYRRVFMSDSPSFDILIYRKDVAKRVNFDCTVTVMELIEEYSNSVFHEDYSGFTFVLEPGDLLAFIGKLHYDADIKYDKLQTAGSFMTVIPGHDEVNTIYYLSNPKIEIQLPPTMFHDFKTNFNGPGRHADIFHSSLVLNALVYALMNYDEEEYGDKLWARTLKYRIELEPSLCQYSDTLENKDSLNILKLAQALLSNPYKRLFSTMHEIINQPTDQQGY